MFEGPLNPRHAGRYGLVALAAGIAALAFFGDPIGVAIGWGLSLSGVLGIISERRDGLGALLARFDGPRLRRFGPPLGLVLLFLWLYGGLIGPTIPAGEDHPVHLYHAWNMAERLLPSGRITGWSNHQFAGYPAFALYAPGPYLLIGLLAQVLPLQWAYNLVFLGMSCGLPLTMYALLRAHGISRGAAFAAGVLLLIDKGIYNELGWQQVVADGIWPHAFAMWLNLFVFLGLRRLMRSPGPGGAALVALAMAGSLLSHPLSILYLGPLVPIYLVVVLRGRWAWAWGVGGLAVGGLMAGFWLWPFLELRESLLPHGQPWLSLVEVGQRLVDGGLLGGMWAPVYAAGLAAMIGGFDGRRPLHRFGLAGAAALILFAARDYWTRYGLDESLESFEHVNFWRLIAGVKLIWLGFAGAGLAALLRRVAWRRLIDFPHVAALGLSVAALLVPAAAKHVRVQLDELKAIDRLDEQPYYEDLLDVAAQLRAEKEADPNFFRVLGVEPRGVHCAHLLPVLTGLPVTHKRGEPTFHFIYRFWDDRPEVLRPLGVRYVVTCRTGHGMRGLKLVRRAGDVALWELPGARSERFRKTRGTASVETLEFTDERVAFRVSDAKDFALQLMVVGWHRWHAELDGEPLDIRMTTLPPNHVHFWSEVDVPKGGTLVFTYRPDARQRTGLWMTVFGLLVLFGLLGAAIWPRIRRTSPPSLRAPPTPSSSP